GGQLEQADQELRDAELQLQLQNTALEKANTDLAQANSLQEAFIRVASHELRTPVTILRGLTELALDTPGLPEPHRQWLSNSKRAGERLHRLVEQLTKVLAAGQFERVLERRPTDLAALLSQAAQDVAPFVEQRKQTLTLELASDLGELPLEAVKIRDCIDN